VTYKINPKEDGTRMRTISRTRPALLTLTLAGVAAAALTGCSGSSSGGSPTAASPQGDNTAQAVNSESFHGITPKANKLLGIPLPTMRGVASEVWYPPTKTLTVTFKTSADKTDQQNVENIVRQTKEQAALKPTKSAKAKAKATSTSS
jgi:hypothetical protein